MKDGCTISEAEQHLNNATIVFSDFEENFDSYMNEWGCDEEEKEAYKDMLESKTPVMDWGIVESEGHTYYISYTIQI